MGKYKTEGIVTDAKIAKNTLTFTISPPPPYSLKEKSGGMAKEYILFIEEPISGGTMARNAKLLPETTEFTFSTGETAPITLGAFLVFMQNRSKLTIECDDPGTEPIVVTNIEIKN